jgi:hypothetical protein
MARGGSGSAGFAVGIMLVVAGGALLARHFVPIGWQHTLLLALGLSLCLIAIFRRSYPALVPGMLVLAVAAGLVLASRHMLGLGRPSWLMLCLGLGFVAIYLLGLVMGMRSHWWPLVPGAALLVLSGGDSVWRLASLPPWLVEAVRVWWPVALVVAGLGVLIAALRK